MLALTGQYFLTDYCEKQGILPGFLEGFRNPSLQPHRDLPDAGGGGQLGGD